MVPTWLRIRRGEAALGPRLLRTTVVKAIRTFFEDRHFVEVETPLLVRAPGQEPNLDVFQTELVLPDRTHRTGYLTTSPEYAMKKLLAAGIAPIFQICKSFRNCEEPSRLHNPEFTILEWYRTNVDYTAIMRDCEDLVSALVRATRPDADGTVLTYQGRQIALTAPWERLTVREAFQRYAGVDLEAAWSREQLVAIAAAKGYPVHAESTWEDAYFTIFLNEVEEHLGWSKPTILYDYPASMAALARRSPRDPRYAERFEFYIAGIELGNAFSELTDPREQRQRLEAERALRQQLGKTVYAIDDDFIRALEEGIPPSAGIAVGVDRLVMLLADVTSIRDVLWFPSDELFAV